MSAIVVFLIRLILMLALYAFLGWALYTLWMEIRSHSLIISSRQIPSLTLTPLEEGIPQREFTNTEVIIGRESSCDYVLPNEAISGHHAHLSYHHNQWWVEDLHSTNGTFLNGETVVTPTVVISGDELRCGKTNFILGIKG